MNKLSAKRTFLLCLVIGLILIVAGGLLFGLAGFNPDSSARDYTSIEVADNGYMENDPNFRDALETVCTEEIEGQGYDIGDVLYAAEASGGAGRLEFVLTGEMSEEDAASLAEALDTALASGNYAQAGSSYKDVGDISVAWHDAVYEPHTEYIWRTSVGIAVALVLLFAYVAIRFKVGMGVAALVAAAHDVLLTLALIALLRIPAGPTVICIAVLALLLSVFFECKLYGKVRQDLAMEERKGMPAEEAVMLSARESRKGIFIGAVLAAAALVVIAVAGLIVGFDLFSFMLGSLLAVIVCTYSSLVLSPALYALIKTRSDARRAERSKYNYASEKAKKNVNQEG